MEYIESEIRKEKQELRSKLIDIYNKGNEDVKAIISLLVQTEYKLAIWKDNYYKTSSNKIEYEKENKELIEKCWSKE